MKATSHSEPHYPVWLEHHLREHREFMDRLHDVSLCRDVDQTPLLSLNRNDYLRLADHPYVTEARENTNRRRTRDTFATMFPSPSVEEHQFAALACMSLRCSGVMLTSAGWAANVGLVEAITPRGGVVYVDEDAHQSFADGIRLANARQMVIRHHDLTDLEAAVRKYGSGVVCMDALCSTDGTSPDVEGVVDICERYGCVLVLDEAHSFGVFGHSGGGLAVERNVAHRVQFRTASLGKALVGHGGLVAASQSMLRSVSVRMRSLLFSTPPSSLLAAGHLAALEIIVAEPQRAQQCLTNADRFRSLLMERGIVASGWRHIVTLRFKGEDACRFYAALRRKGVLVSVFVFPTVPKGVSVARFSIHSELTEQQIDYASACVRAVCEPGLSPL